MVSDGTLIRTTTHRGLIWLTGPAGSGKSTIAKKLDALIRCRIVDEWMIREHFLKGNQGGSMDTRNAVTVASGNAMANFAGNWDVVIVCDTAPNRKCREWTAQNIHKKTNRCVHFFECWAPQPELAKRRPALWKNPKDVVGFDIEYQSQKMGVWPWHELNTMKLTADECATEVLNFLRGWAGHSLA